MDLERLTGPAGVAVVAGGLCLLVAALGSLGPPLTWSAADTFAAQSLLPRRRFGFLVGALGLAVVMAATPVLLLRAQGTAGLASVTAGWLGFAVGGTLFVMALGVTAIAMPALGELAGTGVVSPQQVADRFTKQPILFLAFLGGNVMFLSWVPIGLGLRDVAGFPAWFGWFAAGSAVASWLGFLHVPLFQAVGGLFWPVAVTLCGWFVLRPVVP